MRSRNSAPQTPNSQSSTRSRAFRRGIVAVGAIILGFALWRHFRTPHTLTHWRIEGQFAAIPAANRYDVLVVGGTPSGIAAALAASRRGARVLLVETRPHLGGDIVYAMLNQFDIPIRPGQKPPVHGIFAEFFNRLGIAFSVERARILFEDTVRADSSIEVATQTQVTQVLKRGTRVIGADILTKPSMKSREILANAVVDATNDADFAARAGAGYYVGREDVNRDKKMQSAGLLFSVTGVDWDKVRFYVRGKRRARASDIHHGSKLTRTSTPHQPFQNVVFTKNTPTENIIAAPISAEKAKSEYSISGVKSRNAFAASQLIRTNSLQKTREFSAQKISNDKIPSNSNGAPSATQSGVKVPKVWLHLGGIHGGYAWERGDIVRDYHPRGVDMLALSINFGRQDDGSVILNTLNILNVNGLDAASRRHGRQEAMAELPFFMAYLRRKMPGFANAKLQKAAPELYIRETRHVHGYYALKVEDIRGERAFYDRVALASYPLDLHPYVKNQINPYGARRYYYSLPLRSLVPRAVDGVFVASRSLSATYSAAGSCRVVPITMAAGEAAGTAAWLCATQNTTPHKLVDDDPDDLRTLQASLREGGADIGDDIPRLVREAAQKRAAAKRKARN